MGWGSKGSKQIRLEIFSLFLAKLPPTEGRIAFDLALKGKVAAEPTDELHFLSH